MRTGVHIVAARAFGCRLVRTRSGVIRHQRWRLWESGKRAALAALP